MSDVIAFIDTVPWDKLTDAYGSARQIPHYLKQIISPKSQKEFETAISWFWGSVLHQDTVFSGAIPAVWILVELVKVEPSHLAVPYILEFIKVIAEIDWQSDTPNALIPIDTNKPDEPPYATFITHSLNNDKIEFGDEDNQYFTACYIISDKVKALFLSAIPIVARYLCSPDEHIKQVAQATASSLIQQMPDKTAELTQTHP